MEPVEIQITLKLSPQKIEQYRWALNELPGRTDEGWQTHLLYAAHDCIDNVIAEARRYREWRGFPSIPALESVRSSLDKLAEATQSGDFLDNPETLVATIVDLQAQYNALFSRLRPEREDKRDE